MDVNQIRKDRLRFTKNKLSSNLALVAILLNVFYFVSIYKSDVKDFYYSWLTGVSIIYNLLFMLSVFLCSEGVKSYKLGYSFALIVIGALQLVRIGIIPAKAHSAMVKIGDVERVVMENNQYTYVIALLVASAVVLAIAGIVGIVKTTTLNAYTKELEAQN